MAAVYFSMLLSSQVSGGLKEMGIGTGSKRNGFNYFFDSLLLIFFSRSRGISQSHFIMSRLFENISHNLTWPFHKDHSLN